MSGESASHVRLVEQLIEIVRQNHRPDRGLLLLADHHRFGSDRPWPIAGFTPDLYASDLPVTFRVVGEAKTPDDLQTERSASQIKSFLTHLALYQGSTFYLAVPWVAAGRAQAFLSTLQRDTQSSVPCKVLPCV